MKRIFGMSLVLATLSFCEASSVPTPSPSVKISPTPLPSGIASPSPTPSPSLSASDWSLLLNQFMRAQNTELKALEHRHKFEIKELKASQDARSKEWLKKEKEARHKFFAEHSNGPTRRNYVKEYLQRRDAMDKHFVEEKKQRIRDQEVEASTLRASQKKKLGEFRLLIEQKKTPQADLWPKAGH